MDDKVYMCIGRSKNLFGVAIFNVDHFIITRDYFDASDVERAKSLIHKFDVSMCICTIDIGLDVYDSLKETNVEINLISKNRKRGINLKQKESLISCESLDLLDAYLNENEEKYQTLCPKIILFSSPNRSTLLAQIGSVDKYKIFLLNENHAMYINFGGMNGLNIFSNPNSKSQHPNNFIKSSKQEKSLFSYINYCSTKAGEERLRSWILFPLLDSKEIFQRRSVLKYILESKIVKELQRLLKSCYAIDFKNEDFYKKNIKKYLKDTKTCFESLKEISKIMGDECARDFLEEYDKIDFTNDFIFKRNIFTEIDRLKTIFHDLPLYLDGIAKKIAKDFKINNSIIYFPQLGYLVETEEDVEWDLKFKINSFKYYKNEIMAHLDQEIGDIKNKVEDLEMENLNEFMLRIKNNLDVVREYLSELDCYVSLVISAEMNNFIEPRISRKFSLKKFYGVCGSAKNSFLMSKNTIFTGRNGTGKSTLIRNIAHIIILNQIGSFVPALHAEIPIFDKLFVKITTDEPTSSFKCDLIQISNIIRLSTEDSLVLIDEFGKGTGILEGVSLFLSLLQNLTYPNMIVITHYQEFFTRKIPTGFSRSQENRLPESTNAGKLFFVDEFNFLKEYQFYKMTKDFGILPGIHFDEEDLSYLSKFEFDPKFINDCQKNKTTSIVTNPKSRPIDQN